jgi:hypothetical protein
MNLLEVNWLSAIYYIPLSAMLLALVISLIGTIEERLHKERHGL